MCGGRGRRTRTVTCETEGWMSACRTTSLPAVPVAPVTSSLIMSREGGTVEGDEGQESSETRRVIREQERREPEQRHCLSTRVVEATRRCRLRLTLTRTSESGGRCSHPRAARPSQLLSQGTVPFSRCELRCGSPPSPSLVLHPPPTSPSFSTALEHWTWPHCVPLIECTLS